MTDGEMFNLFILISKTFKLCHFTNKCAIRVMIVTSDGKNYLEDHTGCTKRSQNSLGE